MTTNKKAASDSPYSNYMMTVSAGSGFNADNEVLEMMKSTRASHPTAINPT